VPPLLRFGPALASASQHGYLHETNPVEAQPPRRAVWRRRVLDTPFNSTGPISVNVTSVPSADSTTSWLTSTSPGLAYSAILDAMFTVRPK
jgi:hypothetical protein